MPVMDLDGGTSGLDEAFWNDDGSMGGDGDDGGFMGFIGDFYSVVGGAAGVASQIGSAVDSFEGSGDTKHDTQLSQESKRGDSIVPTLVTVGLVVGGVVLVAFIGYAVFAR